MCNIKAIQESFPPHKIGVYGTLTGAFLAIGVFLAAFIGGVSLPTDEAKWEDDKMWRLTYAFPSVFVFTQLLMVLLRWKYEPIDYLIKQKKDEDALKFIPMIYNIPAHKNIDKNDKDACRQYYTQFVEKRRDELLKAEADSKKITFKEAVFGEDYYRATWMSSFLNVGN